MLEDEGKLLTWALPAVPSPGRSMEATLLADHRLAYLAYEGELSGGRGRVTRWDAGDFEWLVRGEDFLCLRLYGGKLSANATLQRRATPAWTFLLEATIQSSSPEAAAGP